MSSPRTPPAGLPVLLAGLGALIAVVVISVLAIVPVLNGAGPEPANPCPPGSPCSPEFPGIPIVPPPVSIGTPSEAFDGGQYWYNFTVESAGGGLLWGNLSFSILAPNGSTVPIAGAWTLQVLDVTGQVVGTYSLVFAQWFSGSSSVVSSGETISLGSESHSLSGDSFDVTGTGAFRGDVQVAIP